MKKIGLLLIALCLFTLVGCFSVAELKSLEFENSPAASYKTTDVVEAKDFSVIATFDDNTTEILSLTNSNLTVQGLAGDKLDVEDPGIHTLKVSYKGFSITFNYIVTGPSEVTTNWAQVANNAVATTDYVAADGFVTNIKTNLGLAYFAAQVSAANDYVGKTVSLDVDVDMVGKEWAPINRFAGTFDGQGHSITNIRITKESHSYILYDTENSAAGLFGYSNKSVTIKNLTLVNTSIDVIQDQNNVLVTRGIGNDDGTVEQFKNYGAVIGYTNGGTATIENVNVVNCYFRGAGRFGGLIGHSTGGTKTSIKNCYVDGSFVAYNPVTSSDNAEGEGDKVGGFVAQSGHELEILNSLAKVNIMGTRDLGGMVGYISAKTTITNCQLLTGSVISASVAGGMALHKGARNLGGVIGTQAATCRDGKATDAFVEQRLVLNNVTVANDIVIVSNSLYTYSNAGKYVGGFRGTVTYHHDDIIIEFIKGTDLPIYVRPVITGMTDVDPSAQIESYLVAQNNALEDLNSK